MSALKYWYKCCSVDELFLLWISSFLLFSASISAAQSDFYLSKNPILWFKPTTPLPPPPIFSPSSQSAGNCVTSCENKVNNILGRHSSSSFLNNFSKLQWLWAQSDSPLLPIQCHFPACKPTPLVHSVSWLLWSSPTDIKLHTNDHPAIANSSSQRIQTSSHLASETADTTVYLLSFLSKTPRYASLLNIFHRTACGIPIALSKHEMQPCQRHSEEDINMGSLCAQDGLSLYVDHFISRAFPAQRGCGSLSLNSEKGLQQVLKWN